MKLWIYLFSVSMCLWLGAVRTVAASDWQLVWADEFDGNVLDRSKWEYEVNARGGGNQELQYYVTNNASVANGLLTIEEGSKPILVQEDEQKAPLNE